MKKIYPDTFIIKECNDYKSCYETIGNLKPDLLIIDNTISGVNVYDLLKKLKQISFKTVIVSSYNGSVSEAFDNDIVDYLLKPIDENKLNRTIDKILLNFSSIKSDPIKSNGFKIDSNNQLIGQKLILQTSQKTHVIEFSIIIRCKADKSYTYFFLTNGQKICISKNIFEFEKVLSNYNFIRTHKSHIVNLEHIESIKKDDGGYMIAGIDPYYQYIDKILSDDIVKTVELEE